jgi:hypothetical protein
MLEPRGAACINSHLHEQYHRDRQYDGEELQGNELVCGAFHCVRVLADCGGAIRPRAPGIRGGA